jgi:hypothetical protein
MSLQQAIHDCDGTDPANKPRPYAIFARRLNSGGTLFYGVNQSFNLPSGINDAVLLLEQPEVLYVEDRTKEFVGLTYDTILATGGKRPRNFP